MTVLAIPQPTSLAEIESRCDQVDAFWPQCESVAHVQEGQALLAAWDEYLARTSKDGRARVAASMRRGEVRIGQLLPKAEETNGRPLHRDVKPLTHQQRHEFRAMAAHPEVVEEVIAESTDDDPASRRKVLGRIPRQKMENRTPPGKMTESQRRELIEVGAAASLTSEQIASSAGVRTQYVRDEARRLGIDIPADRVLGKTRQIDPNRILGETVSTLEGVAYSLGLLGDDLADLDVEQVAYWVASLSDSIRPINRLIKALKEINP